MSDREMVAALRARDRLAPSQIFDVYGARLYAYCHELLADHGLASDAIRDTFVVAFERAGELADPDRLGAWMYALARNECVRLGISDEIPADSGKAVRGDRFVRVALDCYALLPPDTREILDLAFRHRLVDDDLSLVLGISAEAVTARVAAAQDDLEHAMTAVFAGRDREPRCPEMEELGRRFDDLDGKRIGSWLAAVNKHISGCRVCSGYLREKRPLQLFEELPHAIMPPGVRDGLVDALRDEGMADYHARVAARAGRFDEDGFPHAARGRSRRRGLLVPLIAIVAVLAVGGVAAAALLHGGGTQNNSINGGTTSAPVNVSNAAIPPMSNSAATSSASPSTTTTTTANTTSQQIAEGGGGGGGGGGVTSTTTSRSVTSSTTASKPPTTKPTTKPPTTPPTSTTTTTTTTPPPSTSSTVPPPQ